MRVVSRNTLLLLAAGAIASLTACTTVGPDYERPESPLAPDWYEEELTAYSSDRSAQTRWWENLEDPAIGRLIQLAFESNNNLEIAGLRVLEARAQLGIAMGSQYPQTQVVAGGATAVGASENAANTAAGDLEFTQYDIGVGASWEIDFWGRYRRGIEAADASYLSTVAAYDQAMILVAAQVGVTYLAIRTFQEQLRIAHSNIASQQRSYDIVDVRFKGGDTSELDVLQAKALLLGTQATIPALESSLKQAKHALSTLLGMPPSNIDNLLGSNVVIPDIPESLAIGLPADLLRHRPDVRQAEYVAMAQNASVGLAEVNLYPSFSISGSLGLLASGNTDTTRSGNSGISELFSADSLTYSVGPSFVWPFLNYDRIKNNVRVQDARLQQTLIAYRETVIQAAQEVADAMVLLEGAREQYRILTEAVAVAGRAADVAMIRYSEGFADYQRVLDAQQVLFAQQGRLVGAKSTVAGQYVALYVALGGGWKEDRSLIGEDTRKTMTERTDWGDMLETAETETSEVTPDTEPRQN